MFALPERFHVMGAVCNLRAEVGSQELEVRRLRTVAVSPFDTSFLSEGLNGF